MNSTEISRLLHNNILWKTLADSTSEATLLIDSAGCVVYANKSALTLFGFTTGQWAGTNVADILPGFADWAPNQCLADAAENYVGRNGRHGKGEVLNLLLSAQSITWEDITLTCVLAHEPQPPLAATSEAFSAAVSAASSRSEARIRAIVDTVVDGIITIDATGTIQTFNPAAESLFGYRDAEIIGSNISVLMPEPYRSNHAHFIARYLNTGQATIIGTCRELFGLRKNGQVFPLELAINDMQLDDERMFTGIVRDISERKDAEAALLAQREKLAFIFAESPVVTYTRDITRWHGCTFISSNVRQIFGYDPANFLEDERFWLNRIHPEDYPQVIGRLETILEAGQVVYCYRFRLRNGSYCWIEDGLKVIYSEIGQAKEIIGCWANIDERKRYEVQLIVARNIAEKANKAKSEFLSSMSHELRTPLNAVLGFAQLFDLDKTLSSLQKQNALEIYKAGKHLLRLIDDVIDLSKIEVGHITVSREPVSLWEILEDCKAMAQPLSEKYGIPVEFTMNGADEIYLEADYTRLKQVILNLLSNAVKYNQAGGKVDLCCGLQDSGQVRISVSDTGLGIEADKLKNLYEPFNRLGAELSSVEGTGIGLAITKKLVESMGGTMGVRSQPGVGSEFWVQLKRIGQQDQSPPHTRAGDQWRKSDAPPTVSLPATGSILVAEDNLNNQVILEQQFARYDVSVDMARNGRMAWDLWQHGNYRMVLTDIHMPGMDGLELTKHIRASERNVKARVPIIAFTADNVSDIQQVCEAAGIDEVLLKPISLGELDKLLRRWKVVDVQPTVIEGFRMPTHAGPIELSRLKAVDLTVLSQMVGNDTGVHRRLLSNFLLHAPVIVEEIKKAALERSSNSVTALAHKLKSSAKAMGAERLAKDCVALEKAGRLIDWDGIDRLLPLLGQSLEAILQFSQSMLEPSPSVQTERISTYSSRLRLLVVDDDPIMLAIILEGLRRLGFDHVDTVRSGVEGLELIEQAGYQYDVIICDMSMPQMDGAEFLRHLSLRGFAGGIIPLSGEDARILRASIKLAAAHQLHVLGALEKPVSLASMAALLSDFDRLRGGAKTPKRASVSALDVHLAINNNEFDVVFQPKVALIDGRVVGVESLARWYHPRKGTIVPEVFIPLAEQCGRIDELTHIVFVKSIHHLAAWQRAGFDIKVAVNMSVDALHSLEWPEFVAAEATKAGVNLSSIIFELTESRLLEDMARALEILTRFSLNKVELSVDDFGTGYSSLEQLQRVPFSELKIDRMFVNGAVHDPSARAILESSIHLARKLDLRVVAEGVETQEEWDLVNELGCDIVQGYFIAKPMTAKLLLEWLKARVETQLQT